MPKVSKDPEKLRPYLSHGLNLDYQEGDKDASSDCIFCGRDDRFNVSIENGMFHCLKCGEKGNQYSFLRKLHNLSLENTTDDDYAELAKDRTLSVGVLKDWKFAKSYILGDWLLPGFNQDGKQSGLYRWVSSGRKYLLPTPTLGHHVFGVEQQQGRDTVALCEGPWDSLAFYQHIRGKYDVLGIPSANTFNDKWTRLFADRVVLLCLQNDHPRQHPKVKDKKIEGASKQGMSRIASLLINSQTPPSTIKVYKWGDDWHDPELKTGYDVRDFLTGAK